MAKVVVRPSGIVFDVEAGESILAAAWRNGLYWPTTCEGKATCSVCIFTVLEGATALSAVSDLEQEGLARVVRTMPGDPAGHRLACQARLTGDVVIRKGGVRRKPA